MSVVYSDIVNKSLNNKLKDNLKMIRKKCFRKAPSSEISQGLVVPNLKDPIVHKLDNGTTLIAQEFSGIDTAIAVVLPYGLVDDVYRPHLLEHLVFRSRSSDDPTTADTQIERLGGVYDGDTTQEKLVFLVRVLDQNKKKAMQIMASSILNPKLSEHDLEREKVVVIGESQIYRSDPRSVLDESVRSLFFSGTDLHYERETVDGIKSVTLDDLLDVKRRYLGARNLHIGIAGPNIRESIKDAIEVFSEFPKRGGKIHRFRVPNVKQGNSV